jgi:hypothetical protein
VGYPVESKQYSMQASEQVSVAVNPAHASQ